MGDAYPTIEWCFSCESPAEPSCPLRCGAPVMAFIVDAPPGFVLRREPCPTCKGAGWEWCDHKKRDNEPCCQVSCPACRGVGGWPVLWAPCGDCGWKEISPRTQVGDLVVGPIEIKRPCSAAGCVDGYIRISP